MRKRRRNNYIDYNYEEAYKKQIKDLEENNVKRMLATRRLSYVYATKEIRAGKSLEVEIYPEFTRTRRDEIPEGGRRKENRLAQQNLNERNSRKRCERLIAANFGDGDIWITLTYSKEYEPASIQVAKRNMQNYVRRLNTYRKKQGLGNAKYIYVTECGDKGRIHHHMIMSGDIDLDTAEKLWMYGGRNQVRRAREDKDGLTGMARYITKPKGKGKEENKNQKIWTGSRNLEKPAETKNHYKTKQNQVEKMVRGILPVETHLEKWYGQEGYETAEYQIRYNDWNGQYYVYARMRLVEGRKNESENSKKKRRC